MVWGEEYNNYTNNLYTFAFLRIDIFPEMARNFLHTNALLLKGFILFSTNYSFRKQMTEFSVFSCN